MFHDIRLFINKYVTHKFQIFITLQFLHIFLDVLCAAIKDMHCVIYSALQWVKGGSTLLAGYIVKATIYLLIKFINNS